MTYKITNIDSGLFKVIHNTMYSNEDMDKIYKFYENHPDFTIEIIKE